MAEQFSTISISLGMRFGLALRVIRELKREGDKLVYSSPAAPFSGDGRMSVVTLVWEKVQ
jgi:hypothetical protein